MGLLSTLFQNYMANHVCGTSTLLSVPPTCLGELRQRVLTPLIGHSLFSEAEQLRANYFAHECEDVARLIRWSESVQAEIVRREVASRTEAAYLHQQCALRNTLRQLYPVSFRRHCPRRPQLTCFPWLDRADRRAGTFDRRAAANFQPANTLTLAYLLSRQSR